MNMIEFFIEFIKLPSILMLGFFFGVGFVLLSAADALISHGVVKTRREAINLMGYPKKKENELKEKKTVVDYLIGGIVILLIMIPEAMKMLVSVLYLMLMYMVVKVAQSSYDKTQALAGLIIFIISPIGAYYFYEKTVVKTLYDELVKHLSNFTSLVTYEEEELE